jgi:DNA-binding transcriptional MerR regulator
MLKISDFSKLAQIPVATLRFYDQIDLLKPAQVDRFTDYRYYTVDQLPRLNRIVALKDMGFSLEQVSTLLREDLSADAMLMLLARRQEDAERELQESRARLSKVAARIREIAEEGKPAAYDIVTKSVAAQWIVSTREVVADFRAIEQSCFAMHAALHQQIEKLGLKMLGVPAPRLLNLYHNTEYTETDLDLEAAVVIARPASTLDLTKSQASMPALTVRELAGESLVASGIHTGDLRDMPQLAKALLHWVGTHDYDVAGPLREMHLSAAVDDLPTGETRLVEVQLPVSPRRVA